MFQKRLKILFVVLSVLTAAVIGRLWHVQISHGDDWRRKAGATQIGEVTLPAIRGSQRWSRARGEKAVDADAKANPAEARCRRKNHRSLG